MVELGIVRGVSRALDPIQDIGSNPKKNHFTQTDL